MWTINSYKIFALRTPGGDRFTEFVDALIRAEAYIHSLPQSEIATNLRTNLGDGGVDTELRQAIPSQTGWTNFPTCWQYKATQFAGISQSNLQEEINKSYSQELIKKGYGYRFCIADDLTPEKKRDWEKILNDEVKKLKASAPDARVITASDLAAWASQIPAIIVQFFKPELRNCMTLIDWGEEIVELTPKCVEIQDWVSIKQQIVDHANFASTSNSVIQLIQGESGVGKTRLVYESLSGLEGAQSLVLYTKDDAALNIAYSLIRDPSTKVILVADECLPETQSELKLRLNKVRDRVRVICIDNSGEFIRSFSEQLWLTRIPEADVERILEQNFPTVPLDRRHVYVNLSRGFVKLAADLCNQDSQIVDRGNFSSILLDVRSYLRNRLNNDEKLRVVEAISLVWKVGYREDVEEEFNSLCNWLYLDREKTLEAAGKLKYVPGFVAFAGRYIYITPQIIAQVNFEGAWERWVANDPPAFLSKIPPGLLQSFLKRVSISASQEVRRIVGDFFRSWSAQLQPLDLIDIERVNRLVVLVETNPGDYLPRLVGLIERSSLEELLKFSGGYQNTRRSLVWLAEKMASFPEFFPQAESILWKLAIAETEPNLVNNATHIWQQLFRILNSGTATPFAERLTLLERRLFNQDEGQIALALKGFNKIFETGIWRGVGSFIVSGRIAPEEWKPGNQLEIRSCEQLALHLLFKAANSALPYLQSGVLHIAIQNMRFFLANGYLEQMKALFPTGTIPPIFLFPLIRNVEDFIEDNSNASQEVQELMGDGGDFINDDSNPSQEVGELIENVEILFIEDNSNPSQEVREWLQTLIPNDFHGKLIEIVGKSLWHYLDRNDQEAWHREIESLARQLCDHQELLQSNMEWLCSPQALSVWALADAMGAYDTNAGCLNIIMRSVADNHATGLAREYIASLVKNYPQHTDVVNAWIDHFEAQSPAVAYELFKAGGDATRAVQRALNIVDKGVLPLEYLGGFVAGMPHRLLSKDEFYEILKRLMNSLEKEKSIPTIQIAIKLVAYRLEKEQTDNLRSITDHASIQGLIWTLLEFTAVLSFGEAYYWAKVLKSLAPIDFDRAAKIASLALVGNGSKQKDDAEVILVEMAHSNPDIVMQKLGELILDEKQGWHFLIEKYRFLIQSLPLDAVKRWLVLVGVTGAQRLARNLRVPYLDEKNQPVVPPLTEFILSEFEDDEDTFQKFCSGSHSLQVYSGDIASQKQKESEIAKNFLNHPLRRIREWADYEINSCEHQAKFWRQFDEESQID